MRIQLGWLSCLGVLLLLASSSPGSAPPVPRKDATAGEVRDFAKKIDQHLVQQWDRVKAKPAARADDSEFVRRIYLDLAGRIPSVPEVRSFLEDKRADKRARLVDQLLSGPRYVAHFTNIWRALLIPEAGTNFQVRLQQGGFESWLKQRVARNLGYDAMVRDLLTPTIRTGGFPFSDLGPSPMPYYLAKEFKPENLAAGTARVFLGVSVECAQCHNHPFADWKREQFWGFAAFFAGIGSQRGMDFLLPWGDDQTKRQLTIPGTKKVVQAKFLDGSNPTWEPGTTTRGTLADWLTSANNPYFARAAVNRVWAYFFGAGLVEPIDEMVGGNSTASHPELLDLLAKEFAAHHFDLKFLVRALTASRAYQLSSVASHPSQNEPGVFARMPLRGLTGEQLFDSLAMATGYRDSGGGDDLLSGLIGGNQAARSEFLTKFAQSERPTEAQTSILHALTLMNGKLIVSATSLKKSETLAAVVDAPFAKTGDRIEALYLSTLTRKPEPKEIDRTVRFVQDAVGRAKGKDDKTQHEAYNNALADVFWALLNSPEFVLNH